MSTTQKEPEQTPQQQEKQEKQQKQQEEEGQDWRHTINWERVYQIICIIVLLLVPFFLTDMYKFRQYCDQHNLKYLSLDFLVYFFLAAFGLAVYRHYFAHILLFNLIERNIDKKYQGVDRSIRAKKAVKWATDIFYYGAMTVYGIIYFGDKKWFPLMLEKNWYDLGFMEQWPDKLQNDISDKVILYLVIQMGQHIYALGELILIRRNLENKFYEWLLHHVLAVTLIFYSIFNNFFIPGVAILLIHDVGDIFLAFFKIYGVFRTDILFYINTGNMIISWFITRVYIYPKGIILPFVEYYKQLYLTEETQDYQTYTKPCYIYMLTLCCILQVMHIYWFCTMLTMLYIHIKKILSSKKTIKFKNDFDFHLKNQDQKSKVE